MNLKITTLVTPTFFLLYCGPAHFYTASLYSKAALNAAFREFIPELHFMILA